MLVVESGSSVRMEEFLHSLGLLLVELLLRTSELHAVVAGRDADLAVAVVLGGLGERHGQLEPLRVDLLQLIVNYKLAVLPFESLFIELIVIFLAFMPLLLLNHIVCRIFLVVDSVPGTLAPIYILMIHPHLSGYLLPLQLQAIVSLRCGVLLLMILLA